jgi:hypothetical protein
MLGVIYQFDSKVPGHKDLAIKYYKRALKIDPLTKSAKKYLKMLEVEKPSVKKQVKKIPIDANGEKPVVSAQQPQTSPVAVKSAASVPTSAPQVQASPAASGN